MLVSLVIMIIYTSYRRHYSAVNYMSERFGGLWCLVASIKIEGSIHQLNVADQDLNNTLHYVLHVHLHREKSLPNNVH